MGMPSEIKRVLMIAPTPFFADRGCHVHIAEQAYALQRLGLEVLIVTYGLGRNLPGIATWRTVRWPWYRKLSPGPSWHKFYVDISLFISAWRAVRRFRPDIIHAHLHEGGLIGSVVARTLGIPLVFDVQGSLTGELLAHRFLLARFTWMQQVWYALERWINGLADVIVAQSTEMRRELIDRFRVGPDRIRMAYDGVNVHTFHPEARDETLAQTLDIPSTARGHVIVYLGGLSPHKGVDSLLAAFQQVVVEVPQAFLLLMGYPGAKSYQAKVSQLGLEGRVRVIDHVPYQKAARYLALGDIAVAPKRTQTEANGKIYNYMAMGLPTVAFDTVVNRDILGDLGIFTQPMEDAAGLARAIIELLRDPVRRQTLGAQVRAKAVADYSWDAVAQRLRDAYRLAVDFRRHL